MTERLSSAEQHQRSFPALVISAEKCVVQERRNMKPLILAFLGCLAINASAIAGDLRITYNHAGLTKVEVTEKKQLHFEWHTGRLPLEKGVSSPMRQSLEAYDSHSAVIWLTKLELAEFQQWIEKNRILDLKSKYPEPQRKTYGSTFHSSLSVELDGKRHSLAWTGDTKVPDSLHNSINGLVQMCHEILKNRGGK